MDFMPGGFDIVFRLFQEFREKIFDRICRMKIDKEPGNGSGWVTIIAGLVT
jgi:hypothetical protein